ncbi:hypothetical protein ACN27F_17085 [Solwaraspora sp. WMMB335]|uniref:hypothetical protein n=1 Tax=Solwaraspora sp. WMMB335 TaxID=3404118 RepID=UPI003B9433A7
MGQEPIGRIDAGTSCDQPETVPTRHVDVDATGAKGVLVGDGGTQVIHIHEASRTAEQIEDTQAGLRRYLERLAERYRWLELQGIQEAGSLRIELEKVYVALKAEPESDYDRRHLARVHDIEVREAADGRTLDSIAPERLAALDAEIVRRTYQPRREQAQRAQVTEVRTIADVVRRHRRVVLLGGPGSGKTTIGQWLALQMARELIRQLPQEVPPAAGVEAGTEPPRTGRSTATVSHLHVRAGSTFTFTKSHFAAPAEEAGETETAEVIIEELPARGSLTLSGTPVTVGQVIPVDQIERLAFAAAKDECGVRYARLAFAAYGKSGSSFAGVIVIDVGMHVRVPVSQVDPDRNDPEATEQHVDLGPARVPILLRLAHYARELAQRERSRQPALSLADYLGRDQDSQTWDAGGSPAGRNTLLRDCLEAGRAVVVLDGLDELPEANRRTVSLQIQDFIERFTEPNEHDGSGLPWQTGGNQVMVTSRYVGYKHMAVQGGCAHFGIQPMLRPAVEQFVRAWTAAVNAGLTADPQQGFAADALIAEIYHDARPAIRELATNPLLVTILATVYWADGRLPDQRAAVYDRVVENLLRIWLKRPECEGRLGREELLAALEPLAADLQDNAQENGLVSLDRIGELIEGPLALMRRSAPGDRAFRPMLDALLATIRKQVGLLAEQSAGNYAFFHRTFQEFLAARHMLADRAYAAERLTARLDDPRWREPLLLALGFAMISPEWGGPRARTRLLEDVLAADSQEPLIPRGTMLVVNALPDLDGVPKHVVGQVVGNLLRCYAFSQDQLRAAGLRQGIRDAFARLRNGPRADFVAEVIAETILRPVDGRDLSGAAAEILLMIDWFTTGTVEALLRAVYRDKAELGWPIRWALLEALGAPADAPRTSAVSMARLLPAYLPMRRLLEGSPELAAFVRGDIDWLWLMIALYGGLGRSRAEEQLQSYQERRLRQAQSQIDVGPAAAAGPPPAARQVEFCAGHIVHDLAASDLSRRVQRHLRSRRPAAELAATFRRVWEKGTNPAASAEGLIGLAALGEDVVPLLRGALTDWDRQPAARVAVNLFRWLRSLVREPILLSAEIAARTLPAAAPEDHQLDLLRLVIEARTTAGGGPLAVSDTVPTHRLVDAASDPVRDALAAEHWAYVFSGLTDDRPDAVWAAVEAGSGDGSPEAHDSLSRGWPLLALARNQFSRLRLPWPQPILVPRAATPTDRYLAMLDTLLSAPVEQDHLAGYLLGRGRSFVDANPMLFWETLAACLLRGEEFRKGYFAGATGTRPFASAHSAVSSEFLATWARLFVPTKDLPGLRVVLTELFAPDESSTEAAELISPTSVFSLWTYASRVADPYLRFRALWRLTDNPEGEVALLSLDLFTLVNRITDPHDQARALEWIVLIMPDRQLSRPGLDELIDVDRFVRIPALITDPENRARAQARLAFLAPERLEELLGDAVSSAGEIVDPHRRAETVSDLRAVVGRSSELAPKLDAIADALPDPWLRGKARGRACRLLAAYRRHYGMGVLSWRLPPEVAATGDRSCRLPYPTGHLAWGLLFLDASAAEVAAIEAAPAGNDYWDLLLSADPQAGVDGLVESAGQGPLRVTTREASLLNRVVRSGQGTVLAPLWPALECTDLAALALISRWTEGDAAARRWQALVQAEAGRLTPENVAQVIELAVGSTDRLRLRAGLALHGQTPYGQNRNRRWSVRRIGRATVEVLARHATRVDHPPAVLNSLDWVRGDIHHDDAEAMAHWLTQAAADENAPASWILASMESVDSELIRPLVDALAAAPAGSQRILLPGLARVACCSKVLDRSTAALRTALSAVPHAIRREVRVAVGGPARYLTSAARAAAEAGESGRLDAVRRMIDEATVWLDDESLSTGKSCLERLKQIGNGRYIALGVDSGYWAAADRAAAELAEQEDVLRLLIAMVETSDTDDAHGDPRGDLLTATYALAQLSPPAFAAAADPDVWEPMLTEWVETAEHWNVRLAAVRLLGLLRRVTDRVAAALGAAMNDVSFVQQAAYKSVEEFRSLDGDVIPELLELLNDESAAVAAATARLLVSVANAEGATADRRIILQALRDASAKTPPERMVYLMRDLDTEERMRIEPVDRLARILDRAIFEMSGL